MKWKHSGFISSQSRRNSYHQWNWQCFEYRTRLDSHKDQHESSWQPLTLFASLVFSRHLSEFSTLLDFKHFIPTHQTLTAWLPYYISAIFMSLPASAVQQTISSKKDSPEIPCNKGFGSNGGKKWTKNKTSKKIHWNHKTFESFRSFGFPPGLPTRSALFENPRSRSHQCDKHSAPPESSSPNKKKMTKGFRIYDKRVDIIWSCIDNIPIYRYMYIYICACDVCVCNSYHSRNTLQMKLKNCGIRQGIEKFATIMQISKKKFPDEDPKALSKATHQNIHNTRNGKLCQPAE